MDGTPAPTTVKPANEPGVEDPRLYTHPMLIMLILAYACNFMDREIMRTVSQAVKLDLKLSDAQLGLLQGFAFVVMYSLMAMPIARLAERRDRVNIISVCLAIWSAMTALCGAAQGFAQLLLFRVGVGVGEGGFQAPAHAMIADAFAPARRGRALSYFSVGATLGTMLGASVGGVITQNLSWRAAFLVVGVPGLILAVAQRLVIRDPPRTRPPGPPLAAVKATTVGLSILRSPSLRHLTLGFTFAGFAAAGVASFSQPYFIRAFALNYAQVGLIFGLAGGAAQSAGLLISGRLADELGMRDVRWHAWLPAAGLCIGAPLAWAGYVSSILPVALALIFASNMFVNWFVAPTMSAVHNLVGPRRVAMAMALILVFQAFIAIGFGPLFTGAVVDAIGQHGFAAQGLGDFVRRCPGGRAAAGAPAALAAACHTTLVGATRVGILITIGAEILAAFHFALAGRHLAREMPVGNRSTAPMALSPDHGGHRMD